VNFDAVQNLLAPTRDSFDSGASLISFPFSLLQCRQGRTRMDEWVVLKICLRYMPNPGQTQTQTQPKLRRCR